MTRAASALGLALAALLSPPPVRAQVSDGARELDEAAALWNLGNDDARSPELSSARALRLDAQVELALTGTAGEPRTHLTFEPVVLPRLGTLYDFDTGA